MLKIKLNLFESICGAVFLSNIGYFSITMILIIALIGQNDALVYKGIFTAYIICLSLMVFAIAVCFLANIKSKREFILYDDSFEYIGKKYLINQISYCEYYVCKWYSIPIIFIYKQQVGGLFTIKLDTGLKINLNIFYKDYLKLKNKIPNIIVK